MVQARARGAFPRGLGLLVVGLGAAIAPLLANAPVAQAQTCVQPAVGGCPLYTDGPQQAALGTDDAHKWSLVVLARSDVLIEMKAFANYRLYMYGPDGSIVGISDSPGHAEERLELRGAAPGRYQLVVDSAVGEYSRTQYTLWTSVTRVDPVSPGTVVLADDFEDPRRGVLPEVLLNPRSFRQWYENGEYRLERVGGGAFDAAVMLQDPYRDASLAVDVRMTGRDVQVGCRAPLGNRVGSDFAEIDATYVLIVRPDDGTFDLFLHTDSGVFRAAPVIATPRQRTPAIRQGGAVNRLELTCAGGNVTAAINGTVVASIEDPNVMSGRWWIGGRLNEARLDNLVLTQR